MKPPFALSLAACLTAIFSTTGTFAQSPATPTELVDSLNSVFGIHKGARAVHSKGILVEGLFTPSPTAAAVSKALHLQKQATPVTVRFSDFSGDPAVADAHALANPRGMAIRFHLPGGAQTDLVTHSVNGFPTATATEFRDFNIAIGKSGPGAAQPTALAGFLTTHPSARAFLALPKPNPASFTSLGYFGVNSFKFVNAQGAESFGRYRLVPESGVKTLQDQQTRTASPNYLMDEMRTRLAAKTPSRFRLLLQLADRTDALDDPSKPWPETRKLVELGTLDVTRLAGDQAAERQLVFLPSSLTPGIEVQDPMVLARSGAYAVSFGRRQ